MVTYNGLQADALQALGDSNDISQMVVRREDSLGNVMERGGVLVAHVRYHNGELYSVAISEYGQTVLWGPTPDGVVPDAINDGQTDEQRERSSRGLSAL